MSKYKRIALIVLCGVLVALCGIQCFATAPTNDTYTPWWKFERMVITNENLSVSSHTISIDHFISEYRQSNSMSFDNEELETSSYNVSTRVESIQSELPWSKLVYNYTIPAYWVQTTPETSDYFKLSLSGGGFVYNAETADIANYISLGGYSTILSGTVSMKATLFAKNELNSNGDLIGLVGGADTVTISKPLTIQNHGTYTSLAHLNPSNYFSNVSFSFGNYDYTLEDLGGLDNVYLWIDEIFIELDCYISSDIFTINLVNTGRPTSIDLENNTIETVSTNNIGTISIGTWNINAPTDTAEPWNLLDFFDGTLSFFSTDIFGNFSIGDIGLICIAVGALFAILKYFAGG